MQPRVSCPPRLRLGLLLASLFVATGCVSYDERGVLNADGSGEVRIVIGLARDNVDHQNVGEVRSRVAKLPGLRWVRTIDSSAGSRRWTGAVLAFDSVEALRPLNRIIALEDLFGRIDRVETDSGIVLRRTIKLPGGSSHDYDFNRVSWSFPGDIVQSDRRAMIDSTGRGARWNLPLGDETQAQATLLVRYEKPLLSTPGWIGKVSMKGWFDSPTLRGWLDALPFKSWIDSLPGKGGETARPWFLALQVVLLVALAMLATTISRTKKRLWEKNRAASGFLPERSSGKAKERSRRR